MSFIEFLGFIISLIALAVVSARKAREERKRRANPELYEQEQQQRRQTLQDTLREMHIEIEGGPPVLGREDLRGREETFLDDDDEFEEDQELEQERERAVAPPPVPRAGMRQSQKAPTRMLQRNYALAYKLKQFQQARPIETRRLTSALQQRRIGRDVVSRDMATDTFSDAYTRQRVVKANKGRAIIDKLRNPQDMVVLNAIWQRPNW